MTRRKKIISADGTDDLRLGVGQVPTPQRAGAQVAAVRGIGKREALKRLEMLGVSTERQRGTYAQTAQESILSLVKSRKATTTPQINAAWKESGRPDRADNDLSRMVSAGQLKRTKLKGERGSRYSVA